MKMIVFKRVFICMVIGILIVAGLLMPNTLPAVGAATQITLNPTDDTDTQSDNSTGTNAELNASQWCNILARFDLSGISGSVTAATFRIYHSTHSVTHTLNLCNVSADNWSEGGTKPSVGSTISSKSVTAIGYVEFDVTSLVQTETAGDDLISFGLTTNLGTWERYLSRQSTTNKPELIVTFEGAGVIPTSTVTPTATVTPTSSPTATITVTPSVIPTGSPSASASVTPTATVSPTATPTVTPAATATISGSLPQPVVELKFNENTGTSTVNAGSSGGSATLTATRPIWSTNVPPNGGASSVDFGTTTGNYAVDLTSAVNSLKGLKSFTITGWVNCRSSSVGSGGNRIVTWINHGGDGVDLVYQSDGSIQVGIDTWPDGSPARSSASKITTDVNAGAANWRFFAVTYDPSLTSGDVKFYFGTGTVDATLDVSKDYDRGDTGTNIGPALTVGHFNTATRSSATDRMFRGLIDQIRVYGSTANNSGALSLSQIITIQKESNPAATPTPTVSPTPTLSTTPATPTATLTPTTTVSPTITPGTRYRVWVSSDIGGGDYDDYQSMVRLMLYSDTFEVQGINGNSTAVNTIIDKYEQDYSKLITWSSTYPTASYLRSIVKDSGAESQLISLAKNGDPRPLYVLVWGGMWTVAHAIQADPTIKSKIRIVSIGSLNSCADPTSHRYLYDQKDLWWVQNDTSYEGSWFYENMPYEYTGTGFVSTHVSGHGALGNYYASLGNHDYREGDSPTMLYFLYGDPNVPNSEHWGGRFTAPTTLNGASYVNPGPNFYVDETSDLNKWPWGTGTNSFGESTPKWGTKNISKYRTQWLDDYKLRFDRAQSAKP